MENFRFNAYTNILFGKGQLANLPELLAPYGKKVLLTYGGGSIKRTGIYSSILSLLDGFQITELYGVEPNPRIASVRRGVELCHKYNIDVILAVGGGSTIDCSKMIAAGALYDGDPWELVIDPQKIKKALPIVTVLTLAATGSEMNGNAVITNPESNQKIGTFSWKVIPQASICDPSYLYTLPPIQTAAGTADIMSHVIEDYFKKEKSSYVQDSFAEGILKTCLRCCPIVLQEANNYNARANLMWAGSMALNGLCGAGKPGAWSCHPMEHELSAYYDITHGVGLAILTPRWMRHILSESTVDRFVDYAVNVWGFERESDKYELAQKAINSTEQFFINCGIPMTLHEVGIADDSKFQVMAEAAVRSGTLAAYVPLDVPDIIKIFQLCL